jgi:tape measure domain-containing protein
MTTDIKLRLSVDGAAQVQGDLNRTAAAVAGMERGAAGSAIGIERMAGALARVAQVGLAGGGVALVARAFVNTADSVTQLTNQLRLAEGSAGGAATAYARLYTIAQQSRLSFTDLGGTYARIARSTSELGISQSRLLGITQAIGSAVAVSGSSAEAANAALVQLGQGLSAGALRGDELNSVMEQTPRLARAIADGLGVTTGELRKMGEQGELTAQKIIGALESQAGVLNKELAGTVGTFAQAMTQLSNAATLLVGQVNKATGASGLASSAVGGFANDLQAASEAMAIAERRGGGFFRQLNDGAGVLIGRTLGLQLINRDFMTLQGAADDARAAIARLDEQERREGKLSIYGMSERAEAMRDLARASRELAAAAPSTGTGSVRSGDTALAAAVAVDEARRAKLAEAELKKYATPAEKFAEAAQAAAAQLGDKFTPELAARIREHFIKPTNEAAEAAKKAAQAQRDWLSQRSLSDLRRQDQAQADADAAAERAQREEADLQSRRDLARLKRIDDAEEAADRVAQAEIDAQKKASDQALEDWKRTNEQVGQSLADALMNGAQSAWQSIGNLFRTLVLRPVIQAVTNPVAGAVTSALGFGGPANAATGAASAGGDIGNLLSVLGAGSSAFGSTLGAGVSATLGGTSLGSLLGASGAAIGNGAVTGGLGLGVGAVAPYALAAVAAYALAKKAFSRELADSGVQGSFSGSGDFSGSGFDFYKGGWLRKDKTKLRTLDPGLESVFDAGAKAATAQTTAYAKALGLPVEALAGYTQQVRLSLSGLSETEIKDKIAGTVTAFGEGLAERYKSALQPLQRGAETLAQTLQRLSGLQTFSAQLNDLGGVFARVARLSVDAREELAGLAGGLDVLGQQALQFVQDYYSRPEIAGIKAAEVQRALADVGITQDLRNRDQFRALVDNTDVSTATGRQQLAALLQASSAFTSVADYLAETGLSLAQASAQAPQTGALAGLFGAGGQLDQISAINNTTSSVDRVFGAVMEVVDAIKQQRVIVTDGAWEVNGMVYDRN